MIANNDPVQGTKTRKHKIFIIGSQKKSIIKPANPYVPPSIIQPEPIGNKLGQNQLKPSHRHSIFEQLPPRPKSYSSSSRNNKVYSYNIKNHITTEPLCNPVRCNLTNSDKIDKIHKQQQTSNFQNHIRTNIFKNPESLLSQKIVHQKNHDDKISTVLAIQNIKLSRSIIQSNSAQAIIEGSHSYLNSKKRIFFSYSQQNKSEPEYINLSLQKYNRRRIFSKHQLAFTNSLEQPKNNNTMESIKQQQQRQSSRIKESTVDRPLSIVTDKNKDN